MHRSGDSPMREAPPAARTKAEDKAAAEWSSVMKWAKKRALVNTVR